MFFICFLPLLFLSAASVFLCLCLGVALAALSAFQPTVYYTLSAFTPLFFSVFAYVCLPVSTYTILIFFLLSLCSSTPFCSCLTSCFFLLLLPFFFFCLVSLHLFLFPSVTVLPLPASQSFRLWHLCYFNVFAALLGSVKLCGAKCLYSQWQDELYKSTELIDVMYDSVRDCFGKEAASCCKDTARNCVFQL